MVESFVFLFHNPNSQKKKTRKEKSRKNNFAERRTQKKTTLHPFIDHIIRIREFN